MDLVDQIDLAVTMTELIFRVNQDQATFLSDLGTAFKQGHRIFLKNLVVLFRDQTFSENLLFRDILIMLSDLSLCGRGDDGFGETLVLTHTLR